MQEFLETTANLNRPEQALFAEIKDACQLWSMAGGNFLKPLFVVQQVIV
jgi:hypothetical protein